MGSMDGWDVTLLVVAGYVGLTSLVRLMARRREKMMDEFRRELKKEKRRRSVEEAKHSLRRQQAA